MSEVLLINKALKVRRKDAEPLIQRLRYTYPYSYDEFVCAFCYESGVKHEFRGMSSAARLSNAYVHYRQRHSEAVE